MPQVVPGILLGNGCYILRGSGDPNTASGELITQVSKKGTDAVSLGSLFIDRTAGVVYVKTSIISYANPAGVWSAVQTA